jgi:hypothetical protein
MRDLRDSIVGRIALIVGVLAIAVLSARSCGPTGEISSERAVEIASEEASFAPDNHQVRLLQQGLPPRAYWAVSLYNGPPAAPTRYEVFLVDRLTGDVSTP